jgi:hypothetical protein
VSGFKTAFPASQRLLRKDRRLGPANASPKTMLNLTLFTATLFSMFGAVWYAIKEEASL